jgi:hypothetical protein
LTGGKTFLYLMVHGRFFLLTLFINHILLFLLPIKIEKNKLLPNIKDFHFLKTISRGGYGLVNIHYIHLHKNDCDFCFCLFRRVYLATKKNDENKTKYAIKVINKHDIRKKNLIDQSK